MKRIKIEGDFRTNFSLGGKTEKVKLSKEIEKIAIESAKATGCLWCGVDIIVEKGKNTSSEEKPYVLEVNASPGTTGIEKTTDTPVTDVIVDFLLDKKNWVKPKKTTGFREMITISGVGSGINFTNCLIRCACYFFLCIHVFWQRFFCSCYSRR